MDSYLSMCTYAPDEALGIGSKGMGAPMAKVVTSHRALKIHRKGHKMVLI